MEKQTRGLDFAELMAAILLLYALAMHAIGKNGLIDSIIAGAMTLFFGIELKRKGLLKLPKR